MDLNLTAYTPVPDVSCFDNVAQHVPLKLSPLTPVKFVAISLQHCIYILYGYTGCQCKGMCRNFMLQELFRAHSF